MGKFYDEIPAGLVGFIERAHVFFVASAPLQGGSVNVSPKATHTGDGKTRLFDVVHKNRVRYLDLTGSGNETISHLLEPGNGRLTIMLVNIEQGAPNIVRLFGKATVHERGGRSVRAFGAMWFGADEADNEIPIGSRAIIDLQIHTCQTSCGYSIPVFEYVKPRPILDDFFRRAEERGIEAIAKAKGAPVPTAMLLPPSPPASTSSVSSQELVEQFSEKATGGEDDGFAPRPVETALEAYWGIVNSLSVDGMPGLSCVRGMRDEKQEKVLLAKRREHDRLAPPSADSSTSSVNLSRQRGDKGQTSLMSASLDAKAKSPWDTTITITISPIGLVVIGFLAYFFFYSSVGVWELLKGHWNSLASGLQK